MKKRILAFLLAVSIAVSVLVLPVSAASINNTALQTAITLGAVPTGQELSANITRGAFAKMLVSFSTYRESVGAQGTVGTLYRDVPGSSQWAPYIRIAVQQGWMNGYTDGSFRPDNTVTLEEACTAVLKLLGYKMTDLNGAFPVAQLNKAQELGLRNQLARSQGQTMTYEDCAVLLYNALTANTASGGAMAAPWLYRGKWSGGHLHGAAQQPEGTLCGVGGHPAALCTGERVPQRQGVGVRRTEQIRCVLLQREFTDAVGL